MLATVPISGSKVQVLRKCVIERGTHERLMRWGATGNIALKRLRHAEEPWKHFGRWLNKGSVCSSFLADIETPQHPGDDNEQRLLSQMNSRADAPWFKSQ